MLGRRLALRDALRAVAILLAAVAASLAYAQALLVEAPLGQLAQPGDYVTMVFLVRSASTVTLSLDATSSHGWQLLGPTSPVTVAAGASQHVAVTAAVPASASAAEPDTITLTAVGGGQQASASTTINVARHLDLRLETPSQVAVGQDMSVTVRNVGNVAAKVTVVVTAGQEHVASQDVSVDPGKSASVTVTVKVEASYQVHLVRDGVVLATRVINTVVHGPPSLSTFTLAGTAYASLDSNLTWQASMSLQGPLSDRTNLDLSLRGDIPLNSHAQIQSSQFSLRLGDQNRDPLGLTAMGGFGVSALVTPGTGQLAIGGGASWLQNDLFAGQVEIGFARPEHNVDIAAAFGLAAGSPTFSGWISGAFPDGTESVSAQIADGQFSASYDMAARDTTGNYSVRFTLSAAPTEYERLDTYLTYYEGGVSAFLTATAPIGSQAAGQVQVGGTAPLPFAVNGNLSASVALGDPVSYARMSYSANPNAFLRPFAGTGVVYRPQDFGWGVSASAGLAVGSQSQANGGWTASANAQVQYYPGTDAVTGRLSAQGLADLEPFTLFATTGWDLATGTVGMNTGVILNRGRWSLQLDAGGQYSPSLTQPWSVQLGLQGNVAFDVGVPESVVQLAGGRRLGTLVVSTEADGAPLANVDLAIGRYRLTTGSAGTVSVHLPPGSVTVGIDLTGLAANLQPAGSSTKTVQLREAQTAKVTFEFHRTSAVEGHVLVDSNGDGVPDVSHTGVAATVAIVDALGEFHAVATGQGGSYTVRGLPPGETRVTIEGLPAGAAVVGKSSKAVDLAPGATESIDFLVQPAISRATVFGGASLRIRNIEPEVPSVPPGSSPLVEVTTVGRPDAVTFEVDGSTIDATRLDADSWRARIPVSPTAIGEVRFTVRATKGASTITTSSQLIIDPNVSEVEIGQLGLGRPSGAVSVKVHVLFEATSVIASLAGHTPVRLHETSPGRWQGDLDIPPDAAPGLLRLQVTAHRAQGSDLTAVTYARIVTTP